jgi:patatin-like phospholipase/acyl hydrolase
MVNTVRRHVLSIDGGGILGLIPAVILAEIEARASRPACALFDLLSGTSTGGSRLCRVRRHPGEKRGHPLP